MDLSMKEKEIHKSRNKQMAVCGLPHISDGKDSACNVGDSGSIPG